MLVKVKEPQPQEWPLIRPGQTIFTYFHFAADRPLTDAMVAGGATCVAYETLRDARGQLPLHFEFTKEDAIRAGEELANPYRQADSDPALLQKSIRRGGETYAIFCISCHGPTGAGDGPVTKRGFPPPPSLLTGNSLQMKDGQLLHILTYGQGSMSDFAGQLSRERRWDVINYVRSIQPKPATPGFNHPR